MDRQDDHTPLQGTIIFYGNMIMPQLLSWSRDRTVNRIPLNLIALQGGSGLNWIAARA